MRTNESRDECCSWRRVEEVGWEGGGTGVIDIPQRMLGKWFEERTIRKKEIVSKKRIKMQIDINMRWVESHIDTSVPSSSWFSSLSNLVRVKNKRILSFAGSCSSRYMSCNSVNRACKVLGRSFLAYMARILISLAVCPRRVEIMRFIVAWEPECGILYPFETRKLLILWSIVNPRRRARKAPRKVAECC